jgi:hypothetical protein
MLDKSQVLFIRIEMATFSCTSARKDAVMKNQASLQRRKAVLQEFGGPSWPQGQPVGRGTACRGLQRQTAVRDEYQDRLRNIRFCLLEAKQERDRDSMKSVATMVLFRDEGHGILLIRLAACTRNLEVRQGT